MTSLVEILFQFSSEVMSLNDLEAFVGLPGFFPLTKIKLSFKPKEFARRNDSITTTKSQATPFTFFSSKSPQ